MFEEYNKLASETGLRETSTFEEYQIFDPSQAAALQVFENMSQSLIGNSEKITDALTKKESPFDAGQLYIATGNPGVGKTHLLEAMLNKTLAEKPELREAIYFSKNTPLGFMLGYDLNDTRFHRTFSKKRIIVIDDLFSNRSDVSELCRATEIPALMALIMCAYEQRALNYYNIKFFFQRSTFTNYQG